MNYVIALTGVTTAINITSVTASSATSGCLLTYTVEIYDTALFQWVIVSTTNVASKYSFIVSSANLDSHVSNEFSV